MRDGRCFDASVPQVAGVVLARARHADLQGRAMKARSVRPGSTGGFTAACRSRVRALDCQGGMPSASRRQTVALAS